MVTFSKNILPRLSAILILASLSACGNSSSSTSTTIPNSETIYYAHNLVFRGYSTLSVGYNAFGQLGSGDLGSRNTIGPLVAPYLPFGGVAMGGNHSVAFINNSTVRSWGYNAYGQLGNGTTTYSSSPIKTVNISGVKAVAAGVHHSLALTGDRLWAWGENTHGQLGVDAALTDKAGGYSTIPVRVNAAGGVFTNISSIAANAYHSLARANGSVWAWGFNGTGQLGVDTAIPVRSAPDIIHGLPTDGIDGIAAGGGFNYAVARNGELWAWGNNDNGQLGNNSTTLSHTPVRVLTGSGVPLINVVQSAAGLQHGLARLKDGTVWAFGYNHFGQLGNNGTLDSPVAVQVLANTAGAPFKDATDIRAFGSSSMAKVGNTWWVWGDNTYGQLGVGSNSSVSLPTRMTGF